MRRRMKFALLACCILGLQFGCSNKGYVAPENTITSSEANPNMGLPENQRPGGYPDPGKMAGKKGGGQPPSGPTGGPPSGPPR